MKMILLFLAILLMPVAALAQTASTYYTVPTASALAALTSRPSTVYTLGQTSATDLRGGIFNWVAGSSATADGYEVIAPTGAGPSGRWFRQTAFASMNTFLPSGGDDTVGVQACIDKGSCLLKASTNYNAMNLVIGAGETLDCQGSYMRSRPGGPMTPIVTVEGRNASLLNCQFLDTAGNTQRDTALSGAASAGSATIAVASAEGFAVGVGQLVSFELASGAHWVTEIANVNGTIITLADAVPYSATAVAVASGGSTCRAGDVLIVQGGVTAYGGGPLTIKVDRVNKEGAVTGASILVPGFYSEAPTNAASTTSPTSAHCASLPTFNVTWGGALNGAKAVTAVGAVLIDAMHYGTVARINVAAPIGIQIQNRNGGISSGSANFSVRDVRTDSVIAAMFVGAGVSNITVDTVGSYGFSALNLTTPGGHRGFYWTVRGGVPGAGSAANRFTNMLFQGYEIGGVMHVPFGAMFDNITFDTSAYYGASIDNAGVNVFSNMGFYATTTGYYAGPNFQGIGLVLANSFLKNNLGSNWGFQFNAASIWVADTNTTLLLPWNTFGKQTSVAGPGAANFLAAQVTPSSYGGTGTSLQFPACSVVFAGSSGVYNYDNTTFCWDNVNKRLGIGTGSPSSALDVGSGQATFSGLVRGNTTGSTTSSLNLSGGNAFDGGTGAAISLRGSTAGFNPGGLEMYYATGGSTTLGAYMDNTGAFTFSGSVNSAELTANGAVRSNTGFNANGSPGLSVTKTVRNAEGTGTCTLIFTSGLLTAGTC